MKKIMLGVLVIIPIIIMLIVGLVTSFVSTQAYIGVESVSIAEDAVTILFSDITPDANGRRIIDLDDYMTVTVLPERAADKTVEWRIEGDVDTYGVDIPGAEIVQETADGYETVTSNNTGLVELTGYCNFRASVSAEGFHDDVIVEVTDADVQSITLTGRQELVTGDRAVLSPVYAPAGSIVTQGRWTSSDESVAVVDGNGIVTAVGKGSADIVMYAVKESTGEEVASAAFTVTVGAGASLFGKVVYTSSRTVDLAAAGIESPSAPEGGIIEGGILKIDPASDTATVETPRGRVTFEVCEENDFVIANSDLFEYDENDPETFALGIGEIPLSLSAVKKDSFAGGEKVAAEWSSSVPEVAEVDENGVVQALSDGETVISATYDGITQSFTLRVVTKVSVFRLLLDDSSLKVGLARETVFASYRFADGVEWTTDKYNSGRDYFVNNGFEVAVAFPVPPSDAEAAEVFYESFVFETSAPEISHFEGNVLMFDAAKITERTDITVTVSPRYPRSSAVVAQDITVTVIPAVEVNDANELFVAARTTQYFDKRKGEDVANNGGVDDLGNIYWRYSDRTPAYDGDIVLGSDIAYCDMETGEPLITVYEQKKAELEVVPYEAEICCSLYGNNHRIYANRAFMTEYEGAMVVMREEGGVVSNVIITPNYDIGEEIGSTKEAQGLNGYALHVRTLGQHSNDATHDPNQEYVNGDLTTSRVEYSILQNAGSGLGLHGVDCTLDGVIIRNTGGTGIYVPTSIDREWDLHFDDTAGDVKFSILRTHNVTMSNMIGTGMSFEFKRFSSDSSENFCYHYYEAALEKGYKSQLKQTGYLDIYNWQSTDALSLIDPTSVGNNKGALDLLMNTILPTAFASDKWDRLVKDYAGMSFVHFGMVSTGLSENTYFEPEFSDDRFIQVTTGAGDESEDILGFDFGSVIKFPVNVWCYTAAESDIQPGATYTVNSRFIDRMHSA